ncbi:hypothetical protein [Chryseobacterium populi]|uniref:Uncharacterized protein n=1 Tax=Chryseobacterium populi TaxID=1144316 RepID=J3CAD4_9FLAO|nr:hypothetical protein [Chryseobacterium populi]EJL67524.1 hypothetical protein PMI13_04193 [Chryseobacterium populi]
MSISEIAGIIFILAIVTFPAIKKYLIKEKSLEEKIKELKEIYPNFFEEFPNLNNQIDASGFEKQILSIMKIIKENQNLKKHERAYIELSKLVFHY